MQPTSTARVENSHPVPVPVLLWQFARPLTCISSGPLDGGIGTRDWVVNATVPLDYDRTDPDRHLSEIGAALELAGTGCGLLTAVDVTWHHVATDRGVHATSTVGLSSPAWAAAPDGHFRHEVPGCAEYRVGTIDIVVAVPVRLSEATLVNDEATASRKRKRCRRLNLHNPDGLGRDRRALFDGRNSGNLRRTAFAVRCPDRARRAHCSADWRPLLDFIL